MRSTFLDKDKNKESKKKNIKHSSQSLWFSYFIGFFVILSFFFIFIAITVMLIQYVPVFGYGLLTVVALSILLATLAQRQ